MKTGYKVCDAMTEEPIIISPESNLSKCAKKMEEYSVGALIVKNECPLGIITEQDIVRKAVAHDKPSATKAEEIMAEIIHTISPEKDIFEAILDMKKFNIRHLPVMDNDKMIGLLTLKDILKIEPQLFDLMVEKFELREEERKPINQAPKPNEGICQLCGNYSQNTKNIDGTLTCKNCQE